MNIVFLDRETLSPQTSLRRPRFPHELQLHDNTSADQVADRIADAEIVIVNKVKLTAAAIERASRDWWPSPPPARTMSISPPAAPAASW